MWDKITELIEKSNKIGISIPLINDSGKGPSVSLTLMFISFNVCLAAMITKWSGFLGGVDPSQAMNLFVVCAGLYFGRKISKDMKGNVTVEEKPSSKSESDNK